MSKGAFTLLRCDVCYGKAVESYLIGKVKEVGASGKRVHLCARDAGPFAAALAKGATPEVEIYERKVRKKSKRPGPEPKIYTQEELDAIEATYTAETLGAGAEGVGR